MRTIAQKYIEEGEFRGIQIGETRGIQVGKSEEKVSVAKNLKKAGVSIKIISQSTDLTKEEIEQLK